VITREIKYSVVLRYVNRRDWQRYSGYCEGNLANGVKGPGWYWACFDEKTGVTDDDWWFGPEPTKDLARFAAEQDGCRVVAG
jgi:hypothetical protein